MRMHGLVAFCVAAVAGAAMAGPVSAQDWPSKPLRLVVPAGPGGNSDVLGRMIADGISPALGQPVVVENVPGAGSAAGTAQVSRAEQDGYTLLIAPPAPITIVPLLRDNLNYSPDDLAPVSQLVQTAHVLAINPDKLEARNLEDLVEHLRANPGGYFYASSGIGSTFHLGTEFFLTSVGAEMEHVPYPSSGEATLAVVAGHADLIVNANIGMSEHIATETVLPIAVLTPERIPELPDVPSVTEVFPDFPGYSSWLGIFMPAGTPQDIQDRVSAAIADFLATPEAAERINAIGGIPVGSTPQEFADHVRAETEIWARVVEAANIEVE